MIGCCPCNNGLLQEAIILPQRCCTPQRQVIIERRRLANDFVRSRSSKYLRRKRKARLSTPEKRRRYTERQSVRDRELSAAFDELRDTIPFVRNCRDISKIESLIQVCKSLYKFAKGRHSGTAWRRYTSHSLIRQRQSWSRITKTRDRHFLTTSKTLSPGSSSQAQWTWFNRSTQF